MIDVGFAVVLLRQAQKLTQYELARRVRASRSWISDIEIGNKQPTVGSTLRLAHALHVKPQVFMLIVESRLAVLQKKV